MNSNDSDPNVSPKNSSPPEEGEEEEDLFYFESDHLAIKGNKDYSEILKTLFVLEAQRERAIKDYEKVVEIQKQALSDPLPFIEKIKNKEDVGIPPFQRIVEVPVIDWSKFDVQIPEAALKCLNSKDNSKGNLKSEDNIYKSRKSSDTHKKPWTTEEQKRLEELLEIYPPESVELRRFKKIAAALGNRTVKQVTSRVQKYFLKLYKAGLPIPGRIPKSAEKYKKSKLHLHQRNNHYLWKPSTFFPHLDIPVKMNDFEEVPGPSISHKAVLESSNSSNYLLPKPDEFGSSEYSIQHSNDTTEYKLKLLKRVKGIKEKELNLCVSFSHFGYKCDFCNEEPIKGTRWHCITCVHESVDFCTDCVVAQMYSDQPHSFTHRLEPDFGELSHENMSFNNSNTNALCNNNNDYRTSDSDKSESSSDSDSDSASVHEGEVTINGKEGLSDNQNSHENYFNKALANSKMSAKNNFGEKSKIMSFSTGFTNNSMESNDTSDSQSFTDTQSVSYEYLRSNLEFDSNN